MAELRRILEPRRTEEDLYWPDPTSHRNFVRAVRGVAPWRPSLMKDLEFRLSTALARQGGSRSVRRRSMAYRPSRAAFRRVTESDTGTPPLQTAVNIRERSSRRKQQSRSLA